MDSPLTLEALEQKLKLRFKEGFLSLKDLPLPDTFKDMQKATVRIVDAIKNYEKITIIGDYDVDGVTSTTIMKLFFEEIGYPVEWIIPNRFTDGYGLSVNIIPKIKGTDLAITVDNGISAIHAAQLCKEEGIELIITDHHLLSFQIPEAYAIINQKQEACEFPYEDVCGAQIAWYLAASLKNALNVKVNMVEYLELVSIAIIADMMPLQHINRAMVQAGIKALSQSSRPAIKAFLEYHQKEYLNSDDIGFFLAPLLNSAGRMDDASHAVEFLTSTNIYDARVRLAKLVELNTLRKTTEQTLTHQALLQVDTKDDVIIVVGQEWHEGVVGIVASRIAQICQKPSIVLSENENGVLKGSGRSFGECDLFGIVDSCREHLEKFGGHQAAIGLTLHKEKLEWFKSKIQKKYRSKGYSQKIFDPQITGALYFSQIDFKLTALIKKYEPYGYGNPMPKFISYDVEILQIQTMGKKGEHMRLLLKQENVVLQAVWFKSRGDVKIGQQVQLFYTLSENYFQGKISLQLIIDKII
ncbi:MAG: single-stranded-DNA-specific exonuclease RecJ [Campylobacterales bacterium]|nr:single-stranded-DNA-specific exonuclease RecJ [Campylobacterales bacterium]